MSSWKPSGAATDPDALRVWHREPVVFGVGVDDFVVVVGVRVYVYCHRRLVGRAVASRTAKVATVKVDAHVRQWWLFLLVRSNCGCLDYRRTLRPPPSAVDWRVRVKFATFPRETIPPYTRCVEPDTAP